MTYIPNMFLKMSKTAKSAVMSNYFLRKAKQFRKPSHKLRLVVSNSGNYIDYKYVSEDEEEPEYPIADRADNYALFYKGVSNELDLTPEEDLDEVESASDIELLSTDYVSTHMKNHTIRQALMPHSSTFKDDLPMEKILLYGGVGLIAMVYFMEYM